MKKKKVLEQGGSEPPQPTNKGRVFEMPEPGNLRRCETTRWSLMVLATSTTLADNFDRSARVIHYQSNDAGENGTDQNT